MNGTLPIDLGSLEQNGRYTPVRVELYPFDISKGRKNATESRKQWKRQDSIEFNTISLFSSYSFTSSMVIPADSFTFTFEPDFYDPDSEMTLDDFVREGDIAAIFIGDKQVMTGIVMSVGISVSVGGREQFTFSGLDILGMFEAQDAVSTDDPRSFISASTPQQIFDILSANVRSASRFRVAGMDGDKALPWSTSAGESKLAAILRYLEPLNALAWCDADGTVVFGRPSSEKRTAEFVIDRKNRYATVIDMEVKRESGRIPNSIVGVWTGCENIVDSFRTSSVPNSAERPKALRDVSHFVSKTIVVNVPDPSTSEGAKQLGAMSQGDFVQATVRRTMARENMAELIVTATVPGHCDEDGNVIAPDFLHRVAYDRGKIDEELYLYEATYSFSSGSSPKTAVSFCRPGTIVADVVAP